MNKLPILIHNLEKWIERNGWAGWDPYDVKELPFYLKLQNLRPTIANKVIRKTIFSISDLFPQLARRFFKVSPRINPKAMGLFLAGYAKGQELYKYRRKIASLENRRTSIERQIKDLEKQMYSSELSDEQRMKIRSDLKYLDIQYRDVVRELRYHERMKPSG